MGARPLPGMARRRRDFDGFDELCDHLLVLDHSRGSGADAVVGTYRLIRREAAARLGAFYSAAEYDIAPLVAYPGEILELGRSCVDAGYRPRPAMQLLWSGIAAYVFHHDIALMFGCASLPGTDPEALAAPLSYLHHHHLAPPALRRAGAARALCRDAPARPAGDRPEPALAALPPLIKGYLRLGGFVGDGAVIDEQFNTTDVCIVVKTDLVTEKYSRHYERQVERHMGGLRAHRARPTADELVRALGGSYLAWTVPLMPVQAVGSGAAAARGSPRSRASIIAAAAGFSASGCARSDGRRRPRPVLFAANHISYLDITVLGSLLAASFIAKTEVAGWPLFGWLARAAALGVRRPAGAQHGAAARQHRRRGSPPARR